MHIHTRIKHDTLGACVHTNRHINNRTSWPCLVLVQQEYGINQAAEVVSDSTRKPPTWLATRGLNTGSLSCNSTAVHSCLYDGRTNTRLAVANLCDGGREQKRWREGITEGDHGECELRAKGGVQMGELEGAFPSGSEANKHVIAFHLGHATPRHAPRTSRTSPSSNMTGIMSSSCSMASWCADASFCSIAPSPRWGSIAWCTRF
jgi:hypothetical protein